MKLQILIPQYKETEEIIKPLLDSIAIQQNVDMKEVGVIVCNDGSDVILSEEFLAGYPFKVEYYKCEHHGVSATRNACLDHATADYVMFCDADDMFFNACGLYIVFREMENAGGFDTIVSAFVEETRVNINGEAQPLYVNHDVDSTFVHGKIHRRQFLIDKKIRWNDELTIHEDSYFNTLCQKLAAPERAKYCPTPFYLWKWRDDSVCRHDPLYLNKTYVDMLKSNTALVREFLRRDKLSDAKFFATSMVFDAYYSMNCDRWWVGDGRAFKKNTDFAIKKYIAEFKPLLDDCDESVKNQIIIGIKNRFFGEGMLLERITFSDWLDEIMATNI